MRDYEPDTVPVNICLKIVLLVYCVTVPEYFDTSQIWMTYYFWKIVNWFSPPSHQSQHALQCSSSGKGRDGVKC